jgi:hypothetical protein
LLVTVAGLSLLTALPWLADVLLTDAYAGLAVLALHLMVMQAHALRHWERVGLFALVAFAAATHGGTFMTILVLLGAGFVVALFGRKMISLARLGEGLLALAFSAALLFATDYVVTGELAWTPGGIGLAFGRMLQDGIVARYLGDHCPDPKLRLCDHRAELHLDADKFFWGESVFNQLGRFKGMDNEMRTIVLGSMADYPGLQMRAAMEDWVSQLVHVRTGYGINAQIWHTYGIIERFVPAASPAMKAARQQGGQLGTVFDAVNRVHVPVAFAAMVLLLGVAALGLVQPRFADLSWLASTVMVAILANALLFGTLSGPHDRYGARLAFLAPLVLLMLPWRARRMSNSAHIK